MRADSDVHVNSFNHSAYFLYSNVDSLLNKKSELLVLIDELKPDIIGITEFKAKNQFYIPLDSEYEVPNYDLFMNKDPKRGVALYFHKKLNAKEYYLLGNTKFEECVWGTFVGGKGERVLIGCIYRSPNSSVANDERLFDLLKNEDIQKFDKVCITGDFNFPNVRWDGEWSGDKNNIFIECIRDAYLLQKVKNPTRHREGQKSTLDDLILVNDDLLISDVYHRAPLGKSDHDVLLFELYIPKCKDLSIIKYKFNLSKGDYINFKRYVAEADLTLLEDNVEGLWTKIKNVLLTGMERYIPKVKCTNQKKIKPSWMNKKVLQKIKKKHKLYKRFIQSKIGMDYNRYIIIRNQCNRLIKNSKKEIEMKIARDCKSKPKKFWKYVQEQTKSRVGINALNKGDGSLAASDLDKAETLNNFFASVYVDEDMTNIPNLDKGCKSNGISLVDILFTPGAVKTKLSNLDPSKAQGPDQIPSRVLKELCCELAVPLCNLFNLSIKTGQLPKDWKTAEVTAIFKKGTRSDPGNYRPVSLTCISCKVLESLIRDELVKFFTDNNLYAKCQHGFRKKRSCVTQLLQVMEDITMYMDNRNPVDIIYLDFRKAFDTVPHERLLRKLEAYGINGYVISWIREFLSDRIQAVKVGDTLSDKLEVVSGIPQGSVLGPVLFTIFINDLPDSIASPCKIFADDTKIYNTVNNSKLLQQDLEKLQKWSEMWNLYFNVDKCKVLHVGRRNPKLEYKMVVGGLYKLLQSCEEEKDLGVIFNMSLNFDTHIQNSINKANKMIGLIKRTFKFINKESFCMLYKALVRPHLEYANSVWYPKLKRQSVAIEKVQRRATKLLMECKSMSYKERLIFLGLHSLSGRRIRGDLIQVFKIYNNIDDLEWNYFFTNPHSNKTRFSEGKIFVEHCNTNIRKFSFSHRVVRYWNDLPMSLKNALSTNQFKNQLDAISKFINLFHSYDE